MLHKQFLFGAMGLLVVAGIAACGSDTGKEGAAAGTGGLLELLDPGETRARVVRAVLVWQELETRH